MKKLRKLKGFSTGMGCFMMTAFFAGATLFTSCTDDDLAGGKDTPENTDAERLLVNNNAEELSKRVTLFKVSDIDTRAAQTRAFTQSELLTMPDVPEVPSDATPMDGSYQAYLVEPNSNYVVKEGETVTAEVNLSTDCAYYIKGTLKLTNSYGKRGVFYILPGGTLEYNTNSLNSDFSIYNYEGTFTWKGGDGFTMSDNSVFMSTESFKCNGNLNINGDFYIGRDLSAGSLTSSATAKVQINGKADFIGALSLSAPLYVGEDLNANSLKANTGSNVYVGHDFVLTDENSINISCPLYVGNDFGAKTVDINCGSEVYIGNNANFTTSCAVTNYTSLYVENKLISPRFEVNSFGKVTIACSAVFNEHFYLTNGSSFNVLAGGYVQSPNTKLDSDCHLKVAENGYLNLGKLYIPNANTASIEAISDDEFAVVKATSIDVNMKDLKSTFKGNLGLHYESIIYSGMTYTGSGVQENFRFIANIQHNGDDKTYIPASACNPGFGTGSTDPDPEQPGGGEEGGGEDPDPEQPGGGEEGGGEEPDPDQPGGGENQPGDDDGRIIIDHVAEISPSEHSHDISATCVYMDQGSQYAYVSWHKRGEEYDGCAEVIQFTGENTLKLVSFMRSERRRDFNHCIVDNNTLYLVGGQGTGGIIAKVPLKNHIFDEATETTTSQGIFDVVKIPNSGDANCVVRNGNYYMVAATGGFYTLDAADLGNVTMVQETPGSAKFIDLNDSKMLTLNLDARGTEAAGAEINVYNQTDYTLSGTPSPTINENQITPINGKNVARLDGNNIYVCLGENGLQRYTNGTANGNFKLSGTNSLVNGMDFDDKYIYVAYGSKGLYVLDKNTLEVMASYKYAGGKSANYVKVVNGHIFVAYGRSGLQVFRLTKVKN